MERQALYITKKGNTITLEARKLDTYSLRGETQSFSFPFHNNQGESLHVKETVHTLMVGYKSQSWFKIEQNFLYFSSLTKHELEEIRECLDKCKNILSERMLIEVTKPLEDIIQLGNKKE